MAAATTIGLKVDVDTLVGYRQGVPSLLRQLEAAGVRASFFFAAGPDRSGLAVRRLFTQRGFLGKMVRNRAPATYGLRTLLYGTLLPAPMIVASDPGIVRDVAGAGHEIGVHGWDHVGWHDGLGRMLPELLRDQLSRAFDAITDAGGVRPRCFAAPGWQCSTASLAHHDDMELTYASDVRGAGWPFLPRIGDRVFRTPQIPTSLPTLDEMWGREARSGADAANRWLALLQAGVNVLTAHAEVEGMAMPDALNPFVRAASETGAEVVTLGEVLSRAGQSPPPVATIAPAAIPGRCGKVWCVQRQP